MKLLACSDLHGLHTNEVGEIIQREAPDWIVLLGDIIPDFIPFGPWGSRLECQQAWWETRSPLFQRKGAITTYIRGNHELEGFRVRPTECDLPKELKGRVIRLEGIPAEHGRWGWSREWTDEELQKELDKELDQNPNPLIVLGHVPPFGLLDISANGSHIGHRQLRELLDSEQGESIRLVLCGHAHSSAGTSQYGQAHIVNVAGMVVVSSINWPKPSSDMASLTIDISHMTYKQF